MKTFKEFISEGWTAYQDRTADPVHSKPHLKLVNKNLTGEQRSAVENYTSTSFNSNKKGHASSTAVNNFCRKAAGESLPEGQTSWFGAHREHHVEGAVKALSSVFTKENTNKKKLVSYAGVPKHIGDALHGGGQFSLAGFTSTSHAEGEEKLLDGRSMNRGLHVACGYARSYNYVNNQRDPSATNHVVAFHCDEGTGISTANHTDYPQENEFLLHHGAHISHMHTEETTDDNGFKTLIHHFRVHGNGDGTPKHTPIEEYPNI